MINKKIILITFIYDDGSLNQERFEEFKECIERNIKNIHIDKIIVFFQNKDKFLHYFEVGGRYEHLLADKVEILHTGEHATYKMLFDYANKNYSGHFIAVCNADIYFDTFSNIEFIKKMDDPTFWWSQKYGEKDALWFLTRYNVIDDQNYVLMGTSLYHGTSDTWCFKAPIKDFDNNMKIGTAGCDSLLNQRAVEAGIITFNPSLTIVSKHLHKSEKRNYRADYQSSVKDYMKGGIMVNICPVSFLYEDTALSSQRRFIIKVYIKFKQLANIIGLKI